MYAVRSDTLAGLRQSALFIARPTDVPVATAVEKLNKYMQTASDRTSPEGEALKFYFANHVFGTIASKYDPNEPLPEPVYDVARGYVKLSNDLVVKLAYYVLMIITREARHFHGPSNVISSIKNECGKNAADFCNAILGHNEMGAIDMLRNSPPDVSLERYVRAMVKIFNEGSWGGAFGGPKWGHIAETLRKMVAGITSPEMFADTAFTLAHNGGPIFNKGMLYKHYDGHRLLKLLDVQHSGQIPQLIDQMKNVLDVPTLQFIDKARSVFPQDLSGYVDWYRVEALGSKSKYPSEKKEQIAQHGMSEWVTNAEKLAAKALAAEMALESQKFYVGPGSDSYALKVERAA